MDVYHSESSYRRDLKERAGLPEGFRVGSVPLSFVPRELPDSAPLPMNLSCLILDEPTEVFAGVFTRNAFPGAPVIWGRERLFEPTIRGVVVNNKVANVCAPGGEEALRAVLSAASRRFGGKPEEYFSGSTGVIGWTLPEQEMVDAVTPLSAAEGGSILPLAEGFMTTDRFPKVRSVPLGDGVLVGTAKGAGMIEPNMATMLCYIATDVSIDREFCRDALSTAVDRSFNSISVDSDQSTSDMVLLFSSCRKPGVSEEEFQAALNRLCGELAEDIVRNGEGVSHVIEVRVTGAPDDGTARDLGKAVVNSPLVKTAICGNDPNVGRIIGAVGDFWGGRDPGLDRLKVTIGGDCVFESRRFTLDGEKEKRLSALLRDSSFDSTLRGYPAHRKVVPVRIDMGLGDAEARVLGGDLTYEYVRENADYRS